MKDNESKKFGDEYVSRYIVSVSADSVLKRKLISMIKGWGTKSPRQPPPQTSPMHTGLLPPEKNLSGLRSSGHGYVLPIYQYSFCKNYFISRCLFHFCDC